MGKKLDALLGRGFKTKKFKSIVNHTMSRLAVIKRQQQARCSVARSDVVQILQLGQHERALLRVEQVVKEQNLLDVLTMLESYCYLLIEKVMLLQDQKDCPEELEEATSSMIYASTRCGQLPELQELRAILTSRFGKEFEAHATQQINNCSVNPKMIEKLSPSTLCMDIKLNVLEGIAREINIVLPSDEDDSVDSEVIPISKEDLPEAKRSNSSGDFDSRFGEPAVAEDEGQHDRFLDSSKMQGIFKDGAQMAQAASQSGGACEEGTTEAAVELSWPDTHDSIDLPSHGLKPSKVADSAETTEEKDSRVKELNTREAISSLQTSYSESEDDKVHARNKLDMFKQQEEETYLEGSLSTASMASTDMTLNDKLPIKEGKSLQRRVIFDDSDYDIVNGGRLLLFKAQFAYSDSSHAPHTTKILSS